MTDRTTGRTGDDEQPPSGYPPEAVEEVAVPPSDPVREATERDLDDPADVNVDLEELRQGGPTRTPGARTTTGGTAGPAMRPHPGRRTNDEQGKVAPTTTGDATSGGMRTPMEGTTHDASAGGSPGGETDPWTED